MSDFEEYLKKKLEEDKDIIEQLSYSTDQLREIYRKEYEYKKNSPALELRLEGQEIKSELVEYYLPEKWEMPRQGTLLYDDEKLLNVLKLIIFNIGVKKTLEVIPQDLIKKYLNGLNKMKVFVIYTTDNGFFEVLGIIRRRSLENARAAARITHSTNFHGNRQKYDILGPFDDEIQADKYIEARRWGDNDS
ncbi:hypothetical protein [Peribacillus frigoritolerans]|uniref:hypothetical protein n=1 Tax=Peribacillus frigoritolerans TaxID=450367 RepID=UPI003D2D85D1